MALDAYTICPCGSGKKLKFCCCKDLLHELEKVIRAMEGDQRVAALEQINRMIAEQGARPALLALQAEAYLTVENLEEAAKSVQRLLAAEPHSPVGLAVQAILDAARVDLDSAIERLQEALESTDQKLLQVVYSAVGIVGSALIHEGRFLAGRGHYLFQAALAGSQDQSPYEVLLQLSSLPGVPVLLKQEFRYSESPPGVPWQGEFGAAMKSARRGAWRAACESLESLNQKVPDQPSVWRNVAILRGWLGQDEQAAEAWHKFATLEGVSADEAVEAEALAGLLSRPSPEDLVDVVRLTYQVPQADRLMELLLSDRGSYEAPVDLSELTEEGQPPPKGAFHIFSRPMPESLEGISSIEELPTIIAEAYVFGRQTDRPARMEVMIDRDREFEERKAELAKRFGDLVGPLDKEEVVERISRLRLETAPNRRFPHNSDMARVKELMKDQRREAYLSRWPNVPLAIFKGRSAREAAAEPSLRNRVLAAILNLELASEESASQSDFDFNELRRNLNLPERSVTTVAAGGVDGMSLVAMGRLDYTRLSDDELLAAYSRLLVVGYRSALFRCAREVVSRPSLSDRVNLGEVFETLVTIAQDSESALQFADMGRQFSLAHGHSPAPWYLHELRIRLGRQEGEECNRLIRLLSTRFAKEPGVAQAIYTLLLRHGVINADGTPTSAAVRSGPSPAEPAAAPSPLWTPDSAASGPKPESKLWLPGNS